MWRLRIIVGLQRRIRLNGVSHFGVVCNQILARTTSQQGSGLGCRHFAGLTLLTVVATLTVDGDGTTGASGATTDLADAAKIILDR
jgi:hypothetical protein